MKNQIKFLKNTKNKGKKLSALIFKEIFMKIVTPEEMGKMEILSEKLGTSRAVLMENAGIKLAKFISEISHKKNARKILFLCGKGNNGGDCFVAGRELIYSGYDVTFVHLCGNPSTDIAKNAFSKIPKSRAKFFNGYRDKGIKSTVESEELAFMTGELYKDSARKTKRQEESRISSIMKAIEDNEVIVDGVFGTGFHGVLDREITEYFKASESKIKIAVDVPSGGNCLTGEVSNGTFIADYTAVFGYLKSGMTQYPLRQFCGEVQVFDIGLHEGSLSVLSKDMNVIDSSIVKSLKQYRKPDSHKGDFGKMLSITGSDRMRGASIMSSMSALRSGVGLLTVASSWTCINNISYQIPEAITLPLATDSEGYILFEENRDILQKVLKSYDSILIGCGMGVTESTRNLTEFIIRNAECPVIIDADGINCIASCIDILSESKTDIILTPHPREMSRLCGTVTEGIQKNRIETAMNFAEKYGVTLVLKGAGTVTADSKQCMVNINGNPGMSRGGSGDVLAGIIASLSAQGYSAFDSCVYSVYIHGLAGDITAEKMGYEAMLPTDIIKNLSASFMSIK